ncbi:GRAM domain-containing protein [Cymbomonas tetramitiformis]|uniref:GRAM domain-containing protein n=1 Tax=Cymbomonas tetramitiformis TaxID=36881 RepID=A0AAE0GYR6_9CHLO|nr:GRAM domain-containing protein [Cymbomonas tetramitiformis]
MSLGFPGLPTTASAEGDGDDMMQSIMLSMESPGIKKPPLEQAQEPEQPPSTLGKNVVIRDNTPTKEDPPLRRDASNSSSTADSLTRFSSSGKIKRVHSTAGEKMYIFPPKNSEVREIFSLPEEENLLEDFNCALQKKILLQARISRRICHMLT